MPATEAGLAGPLHHVDHVGRVLGPQPPADPVVAGQVGGALGRGDQVVGGERVRRVRELHGLDRRAELPRDVERLLEALEHTGLDPLPLARELLGHAEADAVQALRGRRLDLAGEADRRRVLRVVADHVAQ